MTVRAIYENGVFRPTEPVNIPENSQVEVLLPSLATEGDKWAAGYRVMGEPRSPLTVGQLNAFLHGLPSLGDDAIQFASDVRAIRAEFPAEANPWD